MGKLGPTVLAFILNCSTLYVFRTPKDFDCFPLAAYLLILIAVFFLLWDAKIYPSSFRKLYRWAEFLIEFAVTLLVMEFVMDDFWLPVLGAFVAAVTKLVDIMSEKFECCGLNILLEYVKTVEGLYFLSITFSTLVLLCVLQATNTVDLHIIGCCGGKAFVKDTVKRSRKFVRKVLYKAKHKCRSRHIRFAPGTKKSSESPMEDDFDDDEMFNANLEINRNYRFWHSCI